jgi:hypothetical protein
MVLKSWTFHCKTLSLIVPSKSKYTNMGFEDIVMKNFGGSIFKQIHIAHLGPSARLYVCSIFGFFGLVIKGLRLFRVGRKALAVYVSTNGKFFTDSTRS